jgi:AraC family transcriptional regulator, regulatory protein of adaptative response / methylated-DNA-[protein]-cysteine methyltransferase
LKLIHAYHGLFQMNTAFKKIQQGETITNTALDSGYESLSGFNETFRKVFGASPTLSRDRSILDMTRIETPLGTMIVCANQKGVCLLEFSDRRMLETQFRNLSRLMNASIVQGHNDHFSLLNLQLCEYFTGTRKEFTVPMVTPGSDFQRKVWQLLQTIPYGSTLSYKQQAMKLSGAGAVRAVARANGMNRIAILIPCHRVIGETGELKGYAGGLWRKKWLLDFEKNHSPVTS